MGTIEFKNGDCVKLKNGIKKNESFFKNMQNKDFTLLKGESGVGKVLKIVTFGDMQCAEVLPVEIDGEYGKYQLIGGMEIGYTIPIEYLEKLLYTLEFEESKGEA